MKDLPDLLLSFRRFQLLYVALRLRLPQALASGPQTLAELSAAAGVPEVRLRRVLRGLIWVGVVVPAGEERYALAADHASLAEESPTSAAGDILFQGRFFFSAWAHLEDYLRDGAIPFERAHGARIFDLLAVDPALAGEFNRPMAARTQEYAAQVASLAAFDDARSVVDVGGGEGQLLLAIVQQRAGCTGIVFDLESQRPAALQAIAEASLAERCRFEAGDMFAAMPGGADVYLLKWVLHDWDDENVARILSVLRRDMPEHARLIIIERVMPETMSDSVRLAQADLNMLALNGGAERSLPDYERLLRAAGLELRAIEQIESRYGFSALIVQKGSSLLTFNITGHGADQAMIEDVTSTTK